jgi:hypothetical protein
MAAAAASSPAQVKVLFSGAPKGRVEDVVKKVEAINKKVGASALFVCGQFFGEPAALQLSGQCVS